MSDLILKTQRKATSEEVSDLIHGTGALTWEWWGSVAEEERDGVAGYLFVHDNGYSREGAHDVRTWVSEQQILDSAAWFISHGFVNDANNAVTDSIGYLDAIEADNVLQRAVLGEVVFG